MTNTHPVASLRSSLLAFPLSRGLWGLALAGCFNAPDYTYGACTSGADPCLDAGASSRASGSESQTLTQAAMAALTELSSFPSASGSVHMKVDPADAGVQGNTSTGLSDAGTAMSAAADASDSLAPSTPSWSGSSAAGMTSVAVPPVNTGSGSVTPPVVNTNTLVTSANGAFWKKDAMWTEAAGGTADVTVDDTKVAQNWDGFGGAFNELGWKYLTTKEMQDEAMKLLFSAKDGAHFGWGRIPIGASSYAENRYTLDDTKSGSDIDPKAETGEANRPPADLELKNFSLERDNQKLIPFIKAAQVVNKDLRFWASPWTPPTWMKQSYMTFSRGGDSMSTPPDAPSYFDGGTMNSDEKILAAYAQYFTKFVQGYKEKGINVEVVAPQNEPGYEQNYPTCAWDNATYTTFVGKHLGPAMKTLGVSVMVGTMSNLRDDGRADMDIVKAVMADATAKSFVTVGGAQWDVLQAVVDGDKSFADLPVWATEHRCGNYPWRTSNTAASATSPAIASYAMTAPNDLAYGVESWWYLRDAITKGKVTSYSAWNMVLDKVGLGNDTSRHWAQDALLVADGGKVNPTPAYYVFRHLSQYVSAGAKVVGTTGGDAVAFKNPDGSMVAVVYNKDAAKPMYTVAMGGKKLQFAMPAAGWATVVLAK